jgi:hypothetical protein
MYLPILTSKEQFNYGYNVNPMQITTFPSNDADSRADPKCLLSVANYRSTTPPPPTLNPFNICLYEYSAVAI